MLERSRPSPPVFAGLLLPLLAACPGALPEPVSRYRDGGGVTGTGGITGTGDTGMSTTCDAPAMVFSNGSPTACSQGGCHSMMAFPPLLEGTDADIWPRLLDKAPVLTSGNCATGRLVDGANRAASVILRRVSGSECGANTIMPFNIATPDLVIVDCLTRWVTNHN